MNFFDILNHDIKNHLICFENLMKDEKLIKVYFDAINTSIDAISNKNKIFFAGNGGSSADAQHACAELVVRFKKDRIPISAITLGTNMAIATATSNDYGYDYIFSRELQALAKEGDVVIGISTSGNSPSIVNLLAKAKEIGCKTIGFTGKNGGKINEYCDYLIQCPSDDVARIQEMHGFLLHTYCKIIEENFFKI